MVTAGTIQELGTLAGPALAARPHRGKAPVSLGQLTFCHTLHGNSDIEGSAAQFNRSVSAMPHYALGPINTPARGTADTLS